MDIDSTKPLTVKRSENFNKWLKKLKDTAAKAKILVRLRRLEQGNKGDHRYLYGSIFELRIDYGPGYRVYCAEQADKIVVILVGGDKSTQTKDIETVKKIIKDFES